MRVPDGLPAANRVCGVCTKHLGQQPAVTAKRERQHFELWQEDHHDRLQTAGDAHRREVAALEATIAGLRRELDERPTRIVRENLDQQTVDHALGEKAKAYHSRDKAFQALSAVSLDHRAASGGRCSCGRRHPCTTADVVAGVRALKGWERRQWERHRRYEAHMLPPGHPGVVDPRWRPETDSEQYAREFDDRPVR